LKLFIKHMVSTRCKLAVESALNQTGISVINVSLGEAEISSPPSDEQLNMLKNLLNYCGLELLQDKRSILIEKIKSTIIEMVHHSDENIKVNFSSYLSEKLGHDYCYMSNLFSEMQSTTIEQFIISHKVERIKELIIYNEMNITQIAWKMNYSSVAHLSNQFKKVTGLSPSQFKQSKNKQRNPIEETAIINVIAGYMAGPLLNRNLRMSLGF
jgi:AraC-like DNA-binding protein